MYIIKMATPSRSTTSKSKTGNHGGDTPPQSLQAGTSTNIISTSNFMTDLAASQQKIIQSIRLKFEARMFKLRSRMRYELTKLESLLQDKPWLHKRQKQLNSTNTLLVRIFQRLLKTPEKYHLKNKASRASLLNQSWPKPENQLQLHKRKKQQSPKKTSLMRHFQRL